MGLPQTKRKKEEIMSLIKRNTGQEMARRNEGFPSFNGMFPLQANLHRIFDDFFRGGLSLDHSFFDRDWNPAVDIVENNNSYGLTIELPGMNKEDVKVTLENDLLTIRGEKKFDVEKKSENYRRIERSYGSFERSFTLPGTINAKDIDAKFNNGVLTLILPKSEETKAKTINVKVN